MSWTAPRTWIANEIVTAAQMNTHVRDNFNEIRGGGLSLPSQAASDFIYASSATQLGRVGIAGPGGSGRVPMWNTPNWALIEVYWVGCVVESTVSTNPATLLGFGTWVAFGTGRVTVAIDAGQAEFETNGGIGGEKTHTLTAAEVPALGIGLSGSGGSSNTIAAVQGSTLATTITTSTGSGGAHQNLQPYIVVYRWTRTA